MPAMEESRMPRLTLLVALAPLLLTAALAQDHGTARPDLVVKEVVAGMPRGDRQEIKVLTATLKPGDKTPFHTHRFPVTAYILEGAFTLEMEGRPPVTIKAGQSIVEPPNVKMTGSNRAVEPVKLLIFYARGRDGSSFAVVH